jgi:hypothetical protein
MNHPLSIAHAPPVTAHHSITLTADEYAALSVVDQLQRAFSPGHRLAACLGSVLGAFVPVASYELVHVETVTSPWMWALVAGALLFSGLSVYRWAAAAFASGLKGLGFVVLCEGSMVASHCQWLSLCALGLLIVVNVASASCALQIGQGDESTPVTPSPASSVTVNVQALQQNVTTSQPKTAAERARDYRARKRHASRLNAEVANVQR